MKITCKPRLLLSIAFALACVGTACFRPDLKDCVVACGPRNECPADLTCHDGFCSSGISCKADGPPGDRSLGDVASERVDVGSSLDADASKIADGSGEATGETAASTDALDLDERDAEAGDDRGDASDDLDGGTPDVREVRRDGATISPTPVPSMCSPAIQICPV